MTDQGACSILLASLHPPNLCYCFCILIWMVSGLLLKFVNGSFEWLYPAAILQSIKKHAPFFLLLSTSTICGTLIMLLLLTIHIISLHSNLNDFWFAVVLWLIMMASNSQEKQSLDCTVSDRPVVEIVMFIPTKARGHKWAVRQSS